MKSAAETFVYCLGVLSEKGDPIPLALTFFPQLRMCKTFFGHNLSDRSDLADARESPKTFRSKFKVQLIPSRRMVFYKFNQATRIHQLIRLKIKYKAKMQTSKCLLRSLTHYLCRKLRGRYSGAVFVPKAHRPQVASNTVYAE
jgi:hypothetical protein